MKIFFPPVGRYRAVNLEWKSNYANISLIEPEYSEFNNSQVTKDSLISFEARKNEEILLNSKQYVVKKSMIAYLQPNAKQVLTKTQSKASGEISVDLLQSQCDEKTGDCRIVRKRMDFENKSTSEIEVIEYINATDCILTDIFVSDYNQHLPYEGTFDSIIYYVCKKIIPFGLTKSLDYFILRAIDYTVPLEYQNVFSVGLNYLVNSTSEDYYEKEHKKVFGNIIAENQSITDESINTNRDTNIIDAEFDSKSNRAFGH